MNSAGKTTGVLLVAALTRAERSGTGSGRVYTLRAQAADRAGNMASASATCAVPHDQARK